MRETTNAEINKDKTWKAEETEFFFDDTNDDGKGGKARGFSLFEEHTYDGHRWGMAIDLTSCTGCNACVIACQAENNIPVVGKEQVINGREMHWIRIDRYFKGSPTSDPEVVHQPLACQQCENAPCENGLPGRRDHALRRGPERHGVQPLHRHAVLREQLPVQGPALQLPRLPQATFRDARNKVRRLQFNPDVTVRMRGVMEKCTFCVQRIQEAKIRRSARTASAPADPTQDGEIVTACQQTCPAEAIVFGDINDPKSRVSRSCTTDRGTTAAGRVWTPGRAPRYLARMRNPNPEMMSA